MSLPQERTEEQRTVLADTGIGSEWVTGEGLVVTFFLAALLTVIIFRLNSDAKANWYTRRVARAAKKAASRWAVTKQKN